MLQLQEARFFAREKIGDESGRGLPEGLALIISFRHLTQTYHRLTFFKLSSCGRRNARPEALIITTCLQAYQEPITWAPEAIKTMGEGEDQSMITTYLGKGCGRAVYGTKFEI